MGHLTNIEFGEDGIEFDDIGTSRISEAYDLWPDLVEQAVLLDSEIRMLQGNVMGVDFEGSGVHSDIFDKKSAYLLYDWIAGHVRERALVLGLKSEYTVARVLLRTNLEARMTGVFMNSLANEEFREEFRQQLNSMDNNTLQRTFGASNPWEVLDEISRANFESTAGIFDIINETNNQDFHDIHNGLIRDTLYDFQYFDPKSKHDIKQCYSGLSSSVHAHIEESLVRRSITENSNPFESPTHSEESLQTFLSQFQAVLDIEGVLILNEYEAVIEQNREVRDLLETTEYHLPGLEDTKRKLTEVLSE